VFHDYVVDGIQTVINNLDKDLTMLTGDKLSSAICVGKTISLIKDTCITYSENETNEITNKNVCVVISGQQIEKLINDKSNVLKKLIESTNRRIIYRASPNVKQLYVSYLQKTFNEPVMMIGDGSNDVSSIMKADIGIGVKGENQTVQKVADIVVDSWIVVPSLLKDFNKKKLIIDNVCQWVIMKHMLTSFSLFGMLVTSFYERIRDPTSPYLMASTNALLFLFMIYYSYYEDSTIIMSNKSYVQGILLGSINGLYVFWNLPNENGIYLAIASVIMQLTVRLQCVDSDKSIKNRLFYAISCSITIIILYVLSDIQYDMFIGYLILSLLMYYIIEHYIC
jgi:soluble P-type ATPase